MHENGRVNESIQSSPEKFGEGCNNARASARDI